MYIQQFTAKNYLVHRTTRVDLSPITVFVGPNGGGKSSFFDAMLNFSMVARGNIRQSFSPYPFSFAATRFHGTGRIGRIGFEVLMSENKDAQPFAYKIDYAQHGAAEAGMPTFQIFNETLHSFADNKMIFDRNDPDFSTLRNAAKYLEHDRTIFAAIRAANLAGEPEDIPVVSTLAKEISRFNRFRLSPFTLAGTSRIPDPAGEATAAPRLGYEGEDMAACLYYMSETKDPALDCIVEKIRKLYPEFVRFEFNNVGADRVAFSMEFSDGRGSITAVRSSHGLLIFMGLMVLIYSPNRPPVMLIEEPENGLTPTALREFYSSIRDLTVRPDPSQRSQVLISSHSPFIICDAWNGEDREFIHQFKVENGQAVVTKLSEVLNNSGITLGKDESGKRTKLGLRAAEIVMCGFDSESLKTAGTPGAT